MEGKAGRHQCDIAESDGCWGSALPPHVPSRPPAYGQMLPVVRVDFPPSVNLIWKILTDMARHGQHRVDPKVTADAVIGR